MAVTIRTLIDNRGLLKVITLPPTIDELLAALELVENPPLGTPNEPTGHVKVIANKSIGFFVLNATPPLESYEYDLRIDPVAQSFRCWVVLNSAPPLKKVFDFAAGAAGVVFTAAKYESSNDEERLVATPGDVSISGLAIALLIEGKAGQAATLRFSPTVGEPAGIVEVQMVPPTVLIGGSGFGLEFVGSDGKPGGFVIDDASDAAPAGRTLINGTPVVTKADDPTWRGLAVRHARFYLPSGTPFLGGHAVDAYVEVGTAPGEGIDVVISTHVPPKDSRPGIEVTIECRDPAATGLQDFIPTLVEAAMELPLDGMHQDSPGGGFNILAGKPVIARLRFARSVADPETKITLAVESQGEDGVLSVKVPDGGTAAKVLTTAAALATAIVADKDPEGADTGGVVLHALLAAAVGLSSCLKDKGKLTIHKVELSSTGHGLPVGDQVKLLIDYSVDVVVRPINVGVLSVQMQDAQPMRVRNRNVGLRINLSNPAASGVQTVELDFSRADMEIEDPGSWLVNSPASLFDILGTRSGRGSTWLEVDLRFKLNLGPVQVSGATIRATLEDNGSVSASLRGLDASLTVAGVIEGKGGLELLDEGGFTAALDVKLVPLNLAIDAVVLYQEKEHSFWLFVQMGVDFPGPIPIANTGLGIYGISGAFGLNAHPKPPGPADTDPIGYQLRWDSSDPIHAFEFSADNITVGAQAVFGTVPDLGFSFSSRVGLFVTVPDIAVRGSIWGNVLGPRMGVTDRPPDGGDPGLVFLGVVVIDPADGVTIGLKGQLIVPVLLKVVVPLGAHFPTSKGQSDNWYIYLGADGYDSGLTPPDGRVLGPMRAEILPDIVGTEADAYVMFRGRGITKWPRGGPVTVTDGLVIAFGFGFEYVIGVKPIAWAEIHAGADILIATHPLTLAGFGTAGGSLNLGPFSVGVDASISLLAVENHDPYIHAQLCGHIDLFFTEIEGCVEMSINSEPDVTLPLPDVHPLDDVQNSEIVGSLGFLVDDQFRRIGVMTQDVQSAQAVWPDALLHLAFAVSPQLAPGYVAKNGAVEQYKGIDGYPTGVAAEVTGSDMLRYEWTLTSLGLYDVTNDLHGAGTLVTKSMTAAWQAGRDGDLGKRPQAGDLVLGTYVGDLFLGRLADGGAGLPDDPLENAATACQHEEPPVIGWAVGFDAALQANASFVMPADPIAPDKRVSRFTATVTQHVSVLPDLPLGINTAALIPPPYDFRPATLEVFTPPLALERTFAGSLDLGVVGGPPGPPPSLKRVQTIQSALITPQEPITGGRLWLILDGEIPPGSVPLSVVDDRGVTWDITDRKPLTADRTIFRLAPTSGGFVAWVEVSWIAGRRLALLGLGGITRTAQAAAAARNAAASAAAGRQAAAAAKQPQQAADKDGDGVHAVLDPGKVYRLHVDMTWEGWIYKQADDGSKQEVQHLTGQATYLPKGADPDNPPSTSRDFFFKTVPKPKIAVGGPSATLPKYGEIAHVSAIHRRQDFFHPEMLTRFLLGYTPAQTETARFCDDPLNVHFSAAHVPSLADAYGYTLSLDLRRVDIPGPQGDVIELVPKWVALEKPELLTGIDARRMDIAVTAPCAMPKPGGTLTALSPLTAEAWYEVYALAKAKDPDVVDGRLEGVTFRTSRWRNPAGMLAGIGFTASPSPASGDVELAQLPAPGAAVIEGSDADFEAALDAIGLDGWPAVKDPRISLLWLRKDEGAGPHWLCAGLMAESPEPIDRPGRVHLSALRLTMPPLPAGIFDIRRSDRTRSRLLWLCTVPFTPRAWMQRRLFQPPKRMFPTIALELVDEATKTTLSGSLQLPLAPSFAEEA